MSMFVKQSEIRQESFEWGKVGWRSGDTGSAQLVVMDVAVRPGEGHAFHRHPSQEEMIIVKAGQVEQWLEEEKETLRAGDAVYIDADVVHASFNTGGETAHLQVVLAPVIASEATGYEVVDVSGEAPWASLRER